MILRESPIHIAAAVILLSCPALWACDTFNEQQQFSNEASQRPEGITRTSESSEVLEEDADDWRTSPLYRGVVRVEPAYPNPVTASHQRVTLPYWITDFNAISGDLTLRAYNDKDNFIALDRREITGPGSYQFDFHPSILSSTGNVGSVEGLHRLFLFDERGELVSYGDLRIRLDEAEEHIGTCSPVFQSQTCGNGGLRAEWSFQQGE